MAFSRFAAVALCGTFFLHALVICNDVNGQTIDQTFNTNFKKFSFTGSVSDVSFQPDGKIMVVGSFPYIDDTAVSGLARLNADGSVDKTFSRTGSANIDLTAATRVAVQPDGKILVSGLFSAGIYRFNSDGSLDASFKPALPANGSSRAMLLQPDGKILMSVSPSASRYGITRLNADGSKDNTFNCSLLTDQLILDIALESDGQVVVAGGFSVNTNVAMVKKYNADGSPDVVFNTNVQVIGSYYANVGDVDALPDGSILISGSFVQCGGLARDGMAKIGADGKVISNFVPGYGSQSGVFNQALRDNGNILVCSYGLTAQVNGKKINSVFVELNPDGSLYNAYPELLDQSAITTVSGVYIAPDGKYMLQTSDHLAGVPVQGIARIYPDGTFDHSFRLRSGIKYATDATISDFVVQPDKKIIAVGDFNFVNNVPRNYITRLNYNGTVDETFNPGIGLNDIAHDVLLQADGKILVSGQFQFADQKSRKALARFHPDGRLDEEFQGHLYAPTEVYSLGQQPDGKILIKGFFLNEGTARLIRLNLDGTPDATFTSTKTSDLGNPMYSNDKAYYATTYPLAIQPDGKIVTEKYRFNPDGTRDMGFTPPTGTYFVALLPDGKLIMRGGFDHYGTYDGLRRVYPNGSQDVAFDKIIIDDFITALFVQPDGRIIINKQFEQYTPDVWTRRLKLDGSVDPTFQEGSPPYRLLDNKRRMIGQQDDDLILAAGFKDDWGINGEGSHKPIVRIKIDTRSAQQIVTESLPTIWELKESTESIVLPTTSTAGLPLSLEVVSGPGALVDNLLTIQGTGTIEVRLTQLGNAAYYEATPVVYRIVVGRRQTIDFAGPEDQVFTGASANITLSAVASSGRTVTFAVVGGPATVEGNTLTITGTGRITIRATQAGDAEYLPATDVVLAFSSKRRQTITFDPIASGPVSQGSQKLAATATSTLPIVFSVVTGAAAINDGIVTFGRAGTVTVQANQMGNDHYWPAEPVTQTFCINPETPVITIHHNTLTTNATGTYQWFKNDAAIAGAVQPSIDIDASGKYTVQITVDGCSSDFSLGVIVTDVIEESRSTTAIFPNPATKTIFIQAKHLPTTTRVSLHNLQGKEVYAQTLGRLRDGQLPVETLPRGIYILIFTQTGHTDRMTIILE